MGGGKGRKGVGLSRLARLQAPVSHSIYALLNTSAVCSLHGLKRDHAFNVGTNKNISKDMLCMVLYSDFREAAEHA